MSVGTELLQQAQQCCAPSEKKHRLTYNEQASRHLGCAPHSKLQNLPRSGSYPCCHQIPPGKCKGESRKALSLTQSSTGIHKQVFQTLSSTTIPFGREQVKEEMFELLQQQVQELAGMDLETFTSGGMSSPGRSASGMSSLKTTPTKTPSASPRHAPPLTAALTP